MRYLIIFLLLSLSVCGQREYRPAYIDSLMLSNTISLNLSPIIKKNAGLITYNGNKYLTLTIKPFINPNMIQRVIGGDGFEVGDFFTLGMYDIRAKLYLTKDIRLVERLLIGGNNRSYISGILIRF